MMSPEIYRKTTTLKKRETKNMPVKGNFNFLDIFFPVTLVKLLLPDFCLSATTPFHLLLHRISSYPQNRWHPHLTFVVIPAICGIGLGETYTKCKQDYKNGTNQSHVLHVVAYSHNCE